MGLLPLGKNIKNTQHSFLSQEPYRLRGSNRLPLKWWVGKLALALNNVVLLAGVFGDWCRYRKIFSPCGFGWVVSLGIGVASFQKDVLPVR